MGFKHFLHKTHHKFNRLTHKLNSRKVHKFVHKIDEGSRKAGHTLEKVGSAMKMASTLAQPALLGLAASQPEIGVPLLAANSVVSSAGSITSSGGHLITGSRKATKHTIEKAKETVHTANEHKKMLQSRNIL